MNLKEVKQGLNTKQLEFFEAALSERNVFLTGPAGVGKSYVLNKLIDYLRFHEFPIGITASTGVAALNIDGNTLHSWLGCGLADGTAESVCHNMVKNKKATSRIRGCKTLIIDEISMLQGHFLDKIDYCLREIRRDSAPFGGIQMIWSGDFLQLPPVFRGSDIQGFAFESSVWKRGNFQHTILTEIVRQESDKDFAQMLIELREGNTSSISLLNKRVNKKFKDDINPVKIYCKNKDVDKENLFKLKQITEPSFYYKAYDWGGPSHLEFFKKNCPAPTELELRVGAQVMLLKNLDVENGFVNGSVGVVEGLTTEGVDVKFSNGSMLVERESWEIKEQTISEGKLKLKTIAERKQIPLKLAFATTIHKAQGQTLDHAEIDMSEAFESGQVYTALSRVRNLESLSVKPFDVSKIKVNQKAIEFYRKISI